MPLALQIITPERVVFDDTGIESVTVPGIEGELTVLPSHAPLITALGSGPLHFRKGGAETDVAITGGFLEVRDDKVVVLATSAEREDEIDAVRAEAARQRARDRIQTHESQVDLARAIAALERATARVRVIERRRRRPGGGQPPQQQPPRA